MRTTRRNVLELLAAAAGATVLAPIAVGCGASAEPAVEGGATPASTSGSEASADPLALPTSRPEGWDPIAFNTQRGAAGAIPSGYLPNVEGPDGPLMHVGKHLPYAPSLAEGRVPEGMIALMFGDASLGRARHPQGEGHFYDWIRVRKATDEDVAESTSTYASWPETSASDNGRYLPEEGDDLGADSGKNTVYLAALPEGVRSGELVRVLGHCTMHGEYVDFLVVP